MVEDYIKTEVLKKVENQFGIYFTLNKWPDFERKIISACKSLHYKQHEILLKNFLSSKLTEKQTDVIIDNLTVGESYFFRENSDLLIFKENMLNPIISSFSENKMKKINIWSAGCCTGEEPFTLAILLLETIPEIENWQIKILATDINKVFLEKALQGKFKKWSLRSTPEWALNKYFVTEGDYFKLKSEVLGMVEFKYLNLNDENAFPSVLIPERNFDFIFCRNVLMYFNNQVVEKIASRFLLCLKTDGYLITSPVEVALNGLKNLNQINIRDHYYFKLLKTKDYPDSEKVNKKIHSSSLNVSDKFSSEIKIQPKIHNDDKAYQFNDPENIKIKFNDAINFYKQKKYNEAEILLENILEINENHTDAQVMLVNVYANYGNTLKAIESCKMFLAKNKNARLFSILASIAEETGNLYEAESLLRQALYVDHKLLIANFMMGNILQKTGNTKASIKYKKNLNKLLGEYEPGYELEDFDWLTAGSLLKMLSKKKT
jgi:chemotaxis protein methyltransferase CheR